MSRRDSSDGGSSTRAAGCVYGLFGVFVLFGLVFAGFGAVPLLELRRAQSWTPTPCTILSSQVEEVPGDDGSTWRVAVTFRYQIGGSDHVSDRYRVSRSSSSGRAGKQRVVDALPPGTAATCYVDPEDPGNAILRRDLGDEWIFVAVGLAFAAFGMVAGVLMRAGRRRRAEREARLAATGVDLSLPAFTPTTERMRSATAGGGPLELASSSRRGANVVFMAVFAIFWNAVSWLVLGPKLLELLRGDTAAIVPVLFGAVFLLAGIGAFVYLGYLLLAWFNPRPKVTLSTSTLRAGASAEVAWQLYGATRRLEDLTVKLEGRRVSTSGGGRNARTSQQVFHTATLAEVGRASSILEGKATLAIPADAPPSHEQQNRATQWVLVFEGTIRSWPDLHEEYLLWVHPRADGA